MGAAPQSACQCGESPNASEDVVAAEAKSAYDGGGSPKLEAAPSGPIESMRSLESEKRHSELLKTALRVDPQLMRGISLKAFDIFLSHTWRTSGRRKFLTLTLRFGWPQILGCFLAVCLLLELLFIFGFLPSTDEFQVSFPDFEATCPMGPWALFFGNLSSLVAFFLVPYLPEPFAKRQRCFLDVTSINQVDPEMMERGVYGLGGFLKASSELWILWSEPYLSRLWCVFELAAYRTANPGGRITLAPLFVESIIVVLWLGCWGTIMLFTAYTQFVARTTVLTLLPVMIPSYGLCHFIRLRMRSKRRLFEELENFKLKDVQCRDDFDKQFIHSAIAQWYGSLGAFEDFVRGRLRQELISSQLATRVPVAYSFMMVTPFFTLSLDTLAGMIVGSVPLHLIASYLFAVALGMMLCWGMVLAPVGLYLCERFASPATSRMLDHGKTLLIFLGFIFFALAGAQMGATAFNSGLAPSLLWFFASVVLVWLLHGGWGQLRVACASLQQDGWQPESPPDRLPEPTRLAL